MTNDDAIRRADAPWREAGIGYSMTFKCAACHLPKQTTGRRLKRVDGLRTYVCAKCAGTK